MPQDYRYDKAIAGTLSLEALLELLRTIERLIALEVESVRWDITLTLTDPKGTLASESIAELEAEADEEMWRRTAWAQAWCFTSAREGSDTQLHSILRSLPESIEFAIVGSNRTAVEGIGTQVEEKIRRLIHSLPEGSPPTQVAPTAESRPSPRTITVRPVRSRAIRRVTMQDVERQVAAALERKHEPLKPWAGRNKHWHENVYVSGFIVTVVGALIVAAILHFL